MQGRRVLMVGAGTPRSAAIAAALIAAGARVVSADEAMAIKPKPEITGVWFDECATLKEPQNTYGPPKKGRGGKAQRW